MHTRTPADTNPHKHGDFCETWLRFCKGEFPCDGSQRPSFVLGQGLATFGGRELIAHAEEKLTTYESHCEKYYARSQTKTPSLVVVMTYRHPPLVDHLAATPLRSTLGEYLPLSVWANRGFEVEPLSRGLLRRTSRLIRCWVARTEFASSRLAVLARGGSDANLEFRQRAPPKSAAARTRRSSCVGWRMRPSQSARRMVARIGCTRISPEPQTGK